MDPCQWAEKFDLPPKGAECALNPICSDNLLQNCKTMIPEHKVLIDFLNNRFEVSDLAGFTTENWATLLSEGSRHRIAPLLYSKIKLADAESIFPKDVVRKLQKKYLATAYRNTVLFHQLNELIARLNNQDIPVILLKGAHLAEYLYKDISLRPMSDLDILVREEDLSEAVQIAFNAGYQFFCDNNPEKEKANKDYDYGIMPDFIHFQALLHPETKCMLEIHCFISSESSPFKIPPSEIWQSAQPSVLNENAVFLLAPEDLIIHLCLHAAYDHLFDFGLSAFYDISITIKHYGEKIDWQEISRRSGQWRTNQCLLLALYFTKKWLGASIPEEIFENFRIGKMVYFAEERIFKTFVTDPLHQHYTQWRNRKGLRDKIRYVLNVLFPSRDFMANRYLQPKNSRFLFGSYFFRFFQAFKGICEIAKTVLHDGRYASRINRGDNDFRLKKWLIKS